MRVLARRGRACALARSAGFHWAEKALGSGEGMQYKAIIKRDAGWWIGWVEDVPGVNAQERTREELLTSLREALTDILESNREATRLAVAGDYEEVLIPA